MSEEISWLLEVAILPGQLDNFRAVSSDLVASSQPEPGTRIYEWFLSADGTIGHIYERYQNSAAVVAHTKSFGPFAERFMQSCRPTHFHVYGSPNEDAKKAIADLGPVYLSLMGGFSR
jgi:quinol monooxygenase YgiN